VSRTRKDSKQGTVIEIIRLGEDAFDLFVNHEVFRSDAREDALESFLCVRYGFCGDEYDAILEEIKTNGRVLINL